MRKRIIPATRQQPRMADADWLELERVAEVEISSEDPAHPIESALLADGEPGWRAAHPG